MRNGTGRGERGGSCIFVHVWRGPGRPTAGRVATDEKTVRRIEASFDGEAAAVTILPAAALERYEGCGLPGGR